ncbi:hypothetical protein [Mycolicibacterium bacteremicum]|uniref:hypothetical protein n=1 Tax=Mycolicibacterium bacteremicum TaxID=564198 RepID=UPI0013FDDC24|nr:hypothetical protein [Mycolicibacterium bacteremicum]MCV7432192.1 hypothetical protein [Mycolicibacterium bacteremicum]
MLIGEEWAEKRISCSVNSGERISYPTELALTAFVAGFTGPYSLRMQRNEINVTESRV